MYVPFLNSAPCFLLMLIYVAWEWGRHPRLPGNAEIPLASGPSNSVAEIEHELDMRVQVSNQNFQSTRY